MRLAFWKKKKNTESVVEDNLVASIKSLQYNEVGLIYPYQQNAQNDADFYWESLEEEDLAYLLDDHYILPWEELFQLQQDPEHSNVLNLLNLPSPTNLHPVIRSDGGLSDPDFKIILEGWSDQNRIKSKGLIKRIGAVLNVDGQEYLLDETTWKLVEKVKEFAHISNKDNKINQKYWAQIRSLANRGQANLDEFLRKTVVLAPEKLQLNLRKNLISQESVVEIQPDFDEAPPNWLQTFDQYNQVQDQYSISLPDGGVAHIVIEPQVKNVLNEIKKMPNRRVSGERAHTFLHNPFAQLGDDATEVISPEAFEKSKQEAEIYTYSLQIDKLYNELGHYISAQLILNEYSGREQQPILLELSNLEQTKYFITAYEKPLPIFMWAGYTIDKTSYLDHQVQDLKQDITEIQKYEDELQAQQVLDLSNYSDRVIGIGEAQKLNSEFIQRDSGESEWLPQHIIELEQQLKNRFSDEAITLLEHRIKQAEQDGENQVLIPDSNNEVSVDDAKKLLNSLSGLNRKEPIRVSDEPIVNLQNKKKDTLLIANNIDKAEFTKQRADQLVFDEKNHLPARLPSSFRSQEFSLKPHQDYGIAWLQNLHQYAPEQVSGCLLADDMGLGKTLQLLCFIGEYLENAKDKKPVLVVAPVSLLENWEAEANRFFSAKFAKILSLYGENLKDRKIPKHLISAQLRDDHGITHLLEEDWRGDADIVLTTYETMRDLEFSLARVDWGIMVCDEAQKIKVPTAMVTKAAKAQKADFKIACTGTPVENSLTDLWCLFDFIQENLLGSLNEFGKTYRRPIENIENVDNEVLEQIRNLIAPQVLRRMKHDVADLPEKIEVDHCKNITISSLQRHLYADVINRYRRLSEEGNQGAMLASLHSMRMICAHPFQLQPNASIHESPKVDWLIKTLEAIKAKNEKVIIFTEFRDIQVFLKRILLERFGLNVTTVNGDSNASSKKGLTRQNLIDRFQATSGFNVIILSTTAVGFGVNIQRANHVIHYTRSWNPAKEDQATDRAYRIG
nr:DEAD/DEAH box helicase [Acinetobacter seifertii]